MRGVWIDGNAMYKAPIRCFFLIVCTLFFQHLCLCQSNSNSKLQTLYESHQWFALRDATLGPNPPLFYQSMVEAMFNQKRPAEQGLEAVIRATPNSPEAYNARQQLMILYFRNGLYHEAFSQLEGLLVKTPNARDLNNMVPLLSVLSESPDQSVAARKASSLHMQRQDGNLCLPLTINGKKAEYILDTGANFSILSESEAARLGLTVRDVNTQFGDAGGTDFTARFASAKDLVIGGLHLKNVAFGVLPDTQGPFVELPAGKRGILGISVILAMQTMRWGHGDLFVFGFAPERENISRSNLAFEESYPVLQAGFQHEAVGLTLDTGAEHTILGPPFAKLFPDLLHALGLQESHKLTGFGGVASFDSIRVPVITFRVGGRNVSLKPAHILTESTGETSLWAAGNLGMDLLNQGRSVTLDFKSMRITLK
jgi:Aspartyl protease